MTHTSISVKMSLQICTLQLLSKEQSDESLEVNEKQHTDNLEYKTILYPQWVCSEGNETSSAIDTGMYLRLVFILSKTYFYGSIAKSLY